MYVSVALPTSSGTCASPRQTLEATIRGIGSRGRSSFQRDPYNYIQIQPCITY